MSETLGMDVDHGAQLLGGVPERLQGRVRQFHAVDLGRETDAAKIEIAHRALHLLDRQPDMVERPHPHGDEAVGIALDDLRRPVVDQPRHGHGKVGIGLVEAPGRRRAEGGNIDADQFAAILAA